MATRWQEPVQAGEWGHYGSDLSPTFWCERLQTQIPSARQHVAATSAMVGTATSNTPRTRTEFLLRHPDADRVLEEYPACRGANMRAGGTLKLQHDRLVDIAAPMGAVLQTTWKRGRPRRPNERVTLTAKGREYLAGKGKLGANTLAYGLRFFCAGVASYRVEDTVSLLSTPCRTADDAESCQAVVAIGQIVVALDSKQIGGELWVRIGQAWAYTTATNGTDLLVYVGCVRQCGGCLSLYNTVFSVRSRASRPMSKSGINQKRPAL